MGSETPHGRKIAFHRKKEPISLEESSLFHVLLQQQSLIDLVAEIESIVRAITNDSLAGFRLNWRDDELIQESPNSLIGC